MTEQLERIGFVVRRGQQDTLSGTILDRYPNLPTTYATFLTDLDYCVTPDEKSWFNTIADFNGTTGSEFRWNELERIIIDGYQDEPDEQIKEAMTNEVVVFWDKHIPFLISCRKFYCYFAICLHIDSYGQIVYGSEPEFEETETVASSFSDFMTKLATKALNKKYLDQII